jgi:hypothetical protein
MPTSADRVRRARLLILLALILALALVFAGTAAAETRAGESSSPMAAGSPRVDPEGQIVKASGSYSTSTGATSFAITTQAPPQATIENNYNPTSFNIDLLNAPSGCTAAALNSVSIVPPIVAIAATYGETLGAALYFENESATSSSESHLLGQVEKVVIGTTTTLSITSGRIANQGFDCAVVKVVSLPTNVEEEEKAKEEKEGKGTERVLGSVSYVVFALNALPEPPAPVVSPPPPPAPAAPALSIAKAKKPLKLKVDKWKTVKVNVTNTGSAATAPGSLQLKATKGVIVKGGKQKLPALLPGGSWTVSYKVQLTAKAKKTSTLSLVGTAGTVTSSSSLVLKLAGG